MLVLSRRPDEKILFPNLGVTIQVLRVQGNVVRLGIDAPPELRILREELQEVPAGKAKKVTEHSLRNQQNKAQLHAQLIQRQLELGKLEEPNHGLNNLLENLQRMDDELAPPAPAQPVCRTLVVDDDSNERELLAGLLAMNGCHCEMAEDGEAALGYLAARERPDFVLLDMFMPRCDGRETLRHIRSNPKLEGLKVFAISGASADEMGVATGKDGADEWFRKPLDPRKLWSRMQHHLQDNVVF